MILKNKLALVTGTNRGVGLSVLKKFSENGADVIACARRKNVKFEQLILNISKKYKNKIYHGEESDKQLEVILNKIKKTKGKNKYDCFPFGHR